MILTQADIEAGLHLLLLELEGSSVNLITGFHSLC